MTDRNEPESDADPSRGSVLDRLVRAGGGSDAAIDALAHRRRLLVLVVLDARRNPVEFESLVDEVVAREPVEIDLVDASGDGGSAARDRRTDAADPTDAGDGFRDIERSDAERDDAEHRERVRVSLHHWHLPKLADAHLLEYDYETGRVRRPPPNADESSAAATCLLDRLELVS